MAGGHPAEKQAATENSEPGGFLPITNQWGGINKDKIQGVWKCHSL